MPLPRGLSESHFRDTRKPLASSKMVTKPARRPRAAMLVGITAAIPIAADGGSLGPSLGRRLPAHKLQTTQGEKCRRRVETPGLFGFEVTNAQVVTPSPHSSGPACGQASFFGPSSAGSDTTITGTAATPTIPA